MWPARPIGRVLTLSLLLFALTPAAVHAQDSAADSAETVSAAFSALLSAETPVADALVRAILVLPLSELSSSTLPSSGGSPERRADLAAAVALALDSYADAEGAARWYATSFTEHPVPDRVPELLRAGELEFSIGEFASAELRVRLVLSLTDRSDLRQRGLILSGRLRAARGETEAALAQLEEATTLDGRYAAIAAAEAGRLRDGGTLVPGTVPAPASLFGEVDAWPGRGSELGSEAAVAPNAQQSNPAAGSEDAGGVTNSSDAPTPGAGATAIQTGSFRVEENAGYMARDLEELGFEARIRRSGTGDSVSYQVLVPIPPGTDPERFRLELREIGLEGFFVRD